MGSISACLYVTADAMVWLHAGAKRLYFSVIYVYIYIIHIPLHSVLPYSFYCFCIDFGSSCGAISSYRGHLSCLVPRCPLAL